MLDEHVEKDRCIARLKDAYALNLHGDSPEVLDGTAMGLLRDRHGESGAGERKGKEEREEEKRESKRRKTGDGSLDAFVKKAKKERVDG
jgi:cryptochrome